MRNAILQSFTSQHCNFGNNEVQMPNHSDVSVQLDRLDVYGSNFFHGFHVSSDQLNERLDPLSAIQIPQTFNCLPGLLTTTTTTTSMCEHASEPRFVKNFDSVETARKRTANVCELMESAKTMKESKKRKAVFMENQCHYQPTEEPSVTQEQRAPVRRSQKLGDRITALQKLVSPFGKTDTASVLQEASVYIKLLQDQIHKLSAPYFMPNPYQTQGFGPSGEEGLSSRGLCLVPVSFTQKLAEKEDQHDYSISRRTVIP